MKFSYNLFTSTAWTDFYQTSSYKKYINKRSRLKGGVSSYYVSFCQFINQTTNGAIYFDDTSKDTNLLAEDSFFSGCLNSFQGGSLSFRYNGQCVQNRICSLKSKVSNKFHWGVHCYVDVSQYFPFQNKINDSSISHSGDGNGRGTIYCTDGAFTITSTNMSHSNTLDFQVCFMSNIYSNSSFQFSAFSNNSQADPGSCLEFYAAIGSSPNLNISSCNYLNHQNGSYFIESELELYATNCSFENNNMKLATFWQKRSKATFEKCYFDKTPTKNGYVIFTDNVTNRIDLNLPHFTTFECIREYEDSTIIVEHNIIETTLLIAIFIFRL